MVFSVSAKTQENTKKNTEIKRTCSITFDDGSTYKVKNYSLQSIKDRVDYRGGQYIRYTDDNLTKTIFKHNFIWVEIKLGVYQKVKLADIEKLTITHRENKLPECEIVLKQDSIIKGTYRPQGITLDCISYSFEISKENGEKLKIPYTWLLKIEKDTSNNEKWLIIYKQLPEHVTVTNYDAYDTKIVTAKEINWVTNKSPIVRTLRKYGENEKLKYLKLISSEGEQTKKQTVKLNFSDISEMEFFRYGKREIKLLNGTVLTGKIQGISNEYIKYFYGEIDDSLVVFAFIFYDRYSMKFE